MLKACFFCSPNDLRVDDDEDCGGKGAACTSGSVDFFYELTYEEMEKFERVVSGEAVIVPGTELSRFDVILRHEKPCLHNIERILPEFSFVFRSEQGERVTGQKGQRYAAFLYQKYITTDGGQVGL